MSTASRSPASRAASRREQLLDEPSVYTIINTNSPLKLDVPMMEGIIQMSSRGQVVIVTPFTLSGAMAPVTDRRRAGAAERRGAGRHRVHADGAGRARRSAMAASPPMST